MLRKFRWLHADLAGDLFYDDAQPQRKTAVFVPGFPDFAGATALTRELTATGWCVIQPHFYGSYDSGKIFTPDNLTRTLFDTAAAIGLGNSLTNAVSGGDFELPGPVTALFGHSFGCVACLRGYSAFPLEKLVLIGATLHYDPKYGCREDGIEHLESVRKTHPHTYRLGPAAEWKALMTGSDQIPFGNTANNNFSAAIIYGQRDKYFNVELAQRNVPELVDAVLGPGRGRIHIVPDAGHPLDDLLPKLPVQLRDLVIG